MATAATESAEVDVSMGMGGGGAEPTDGVHACVATVYCWMPLVCRAMQGRRVESSSILRTHMMTDAYIGEQQTRNVTCKQKMVNPSSAGSPARAVAAAADGLCNAQSPAGTTNERIESLSANVEQKSKNDSPPPKLQATLLGAARPRR